MAQSDPDGRGRGGDRSRQRGSRFVPSAQVIGVAFVLLILAGYFTWMIIEMGGHAVQRAWPMIAVLAAAVAGSIAATLGVLLGRRGNDSRRD